MSIDRYRPIAAGALILLLAALNLGYLVAYTNGPPAVSQYSAKWDMPQVKMLNLFLIVLLVVLAVLKPNVDEAEG